MKFFSGKKNNNNGLNYLEMTPECNYGHEKRDDGLINVLVPKFTDPVFGKLLQPRIKKPYIRANMDKFGTATWLLMDGKTNVKLIGEKLVEEFGDEIEPVYDRLTTFLTNLYKNGFITFNELKKGNTNG